MSGRHRRRVSVALWTVLAVVLAATLAWGASGGGPVTPAQRAGALDAVLKCPSCDGISVADSSASTAVAIRQLVLTRVRAGQSDGRIEAYLVSRYGPSILLRPPATGLTALVWVLPVVVAAGGLGGLGLFFWRGRRPMAVTLSTADRALVERALVEQAPVEQALAGAGPGGAGPGGAGPGRVRRP